MKNGTKLNIKHIFHIYVWNAKYLTLFLSSFDNNLATISPKFLFGGYLPGDRFYNWDVMPHCTFYPSCIQVYWLTYYSIMLTRDLLLICDLFYILYRLYVYGRAARCSYPLGFDFWELSYVEDRIYRSGTTPKIEMSVCIFEICSKWKMVIRNAE